MCKICESSKSLENFFEKHLNLIELVILSNFVSFSRVKRLNKKNLLHFYYLFIKIF